MDRASFQDNSVKQDIADFNAARKSSNTMQGLRNPLKMKATDQNVQYSNFMKRSIETLKMEPWSESKVNTWIKEEMPQV